MKRLYFKNLLLQSPWDRRARRISFDRHSTMIMGENGAGKSALLTSLYRCFGAEPTQMDHEWTGAEMYTALTVERDGKEFHLVHAHPIYAIFDQNGALVRAFHGGQGLGEFLTTWLGYQRSPGDLGLSGELTPGALLAPFYMDQESSWLKPWAGFSDLGYFSSSTADLAEFVVSTKDTRYFERKDKLSHFNQEKLRLKATESGLSAVQSGISRQNYSPLPQSFDESKHAQEIAKVADQLSSIRQKQETFREQFVALSNRRREIEIQIGIARHAAREARSDYEYALDAPTEVHCPTCGAQYHNSFRERFALRNDEDDCLAVVRRLESEVAGVNRQLSLLISGYKRSDEEAAEFETHLHRKLGNDAVELRDLINRRSYEMLEQVVTEKRTDIYNEIANVENTIKMHQDGLDQAERSEYRKRVLVKYNQLMTAFLGSLGASKAFPPNTVFGGIYMNLTPSVRARGVKGSVLPRTLLAYKLAVLWLMDEFSPGYLCPLVIDSPWQQGPDLSTQRAVLEFVRDHRPPGQQLVLACVDNPGVRFEGKSETLIGERQLLTESEYRSVAAEMRRFIDKLPINPPMWSRV